MPTPLTVPLLGPLAALAARLFPFPCLGCAIPLPLPSPPLGLCARCHQRLSPPELPACERCARPLLAAQAAARPWCGPCLRQPPPFERLLYAYCYEGPMAPVVRALKFRGADFLGRDLAAALWERHAGVLAGCDLVTPVPLSWRRLLRRGYNQSEAIAGPLAQRLGRPLVRLLGRRHRQRQTSLRRRQRMANPQLAFTCRRQLAGKSVLLVDDVLTTGATLEAAALALRAAGAAEVLGAVAARTPRNLARGGPVGAVRGASD